jgi:hypothetical protein
MYFCEIPRPGRFELSPVQVIHGFFVASKGSAPFIHAHTRLELGIIAARELPA